VRERSPTDGQRFLVSNTTEHAHAHAHAHALYTADGQRFLVSTPTPTHVALSALH
jgi:hypothetical protein